LYVGATDDAGPTGGGPVGGGGDVPPPADMTPSTKALTTPVILFYAGGPDHLFPHEPTDGFENTPVESPYDGPISIGGGTDFNGDGFTDMIESGAISDMFQGKRVFGVNIVTSSKKLDMPFDLDHIMPLYLGGQL
jgi:hypothetical protein